MPHPCQNLNRMANLMQKRHRMLTRFFKLLTKSDTHMRKIIGAIVLLALFFGCQESESPTEITGNETIHELEAGPDYNVHGHATFKEKKDGTTIILIELEGTEGNVRHPVHLHRNDVSEPDAEIAALLAPVLGSTGKSQSVLTTLADGTPITYNELKTFNGCIKIHLGDSGPERDIILAIGNIGSNSMARSSGKIGLCKSE